MLVVAQAAAAAQQKETITMTREASVVRWLDEILPQARSRYHLVPGSTSVSTSARTKRASWLSVAVTDADDNQIGRSLPIDKPESIGPYFDALAAKAYPVAAAKRTKPLQR
jgi:hypothetical protein